MDIKINTDNHIKGSESFSQEYRDLLEKSLKRFDEYITSFDVYFSDENKAKKAIDDKRCVIEARIKGRKPESVSHNADTIKHSFDGACEKMKAVLSKVVDQYKTH